MGMVLRVQHVSVPMPSGGIGAARRFYGEALGLTEVVPPEGLNPPNFCWFRVGPDGQEIHVFTEERLGAGSIAQHLCLQVDDLAALRQRLTLTGMDIEDPTPIHNRPRCFIRDPFGNKIELTEIIGEYR